MVGMIALERERQGRPTHMTRRGEEQDTSMGAMQQMELDTAEAHPAGVKEILDMDIQDPAILIKDLEAIIQAPVMHPSSLDIREQMGKRTIIHQATDPVADMEGVLGYLGTRILWILGVAGRGVRVENLQQSWEEEMKGSMGAGGVEEVVGKRV